MVGISETRTIPRTIHQVPPVERRSRARQAAAMIRGL